MKRPCCIKLGHSPYMGIQVLYQTISGTRRSNTMKKPLITTIILTLLAGLASADMPSALRGTWILDAEATVKNLKTSPKWKAEDEKYLPSILKRMSQIEHGFTHDEVTVSFRNKKQSIQVDAVKKDENKYLLSAKAGEHEITLTVTLKSGNRINIQSSATDDMDYYLWKRGALSKDKGVSDQKIVTEILKKSLESPP